MMTWMPNKSLFDSAEALELDQLAVATVEGASLFNEMLYGEPTDGQMKAPVPLIGMWAGYEAALAAYVAACATTMVRYGVSATNRALQLSQSLVALRRHEEVPFVLPPWFEDLDVLRSHRSNLMRRWPESYSWRGTPQRMPYLWPIVDEDGGYVLKLSKYDKGLLASGERVLPRSIAGRIDQ
ncbi:hypothetical protein SEA_KATE_52 [Microbacterium phage Kate]|nr:hypothetical protein SEA_KATE_52 [Microbacterium phage Kate]